VHENQSRASKAKRRGIGSWKEASPVPLLSPRTKSCGSLRARGTDRGEINEQERRRSAARAGAPGDQMKI